MTRRSHLLAISLLAAALATTAVRAETTGATLLSWCSGKDQGLLLCVGYLRGVSEATADSDRRSCTANASTAELRKSIVEYLEGNRDLLAKGASALAANAMTLAFPCSNRN